MGFASVLGTEPLNKVGKKDKAPNNAPSRASGAPFGPNTKTNIQAISLKSTHTRKHVFDTGTVVDDEINSGLGEELLLDLHARFGEARHKGIMDERINQKTM